MGARGYLQCLALRDFQRSVRVVHSAVFTEVGRWCAAADRLFCCSPCPTTGACLRQDHYLAHQQHDEGCHPGLPVSHCVLTTVAAFVPGVWVAPANHA